MSDELQNAIKALREIHFEGVAALPDALVYGLGFVAVTSDGSMTHMPVKEVLAWAEQIGPLTQGDPTRDQGAGDQADDA